MRAQRRWTCSRVSAMAGHSRTAVARGSTEGARAGRCATFRDPHRRPARAIAVLSCRRHSSFRSRMNLDWSRLKAVVLQSDDWGLCAWSPDEPARQALAGTPAFRSRAGRRYQGSTLESASDVRALSEALLEFRGGDGIAPVWQANTVMASPDYARFAPPGFEGEPMPLLECPAVPSRWQRPGLREQVAASITSGAWWPELHGLHHLPEHAWRAALKRGDADALAAHAQQVPVCAAVEASGEYDAREPRALRAGHLDRAVARFHTVFDRAPNSIC